jgi:hypothetical protein
MFLGLSLDVSINLSVLAWYLPHGACCMLLRAWSCNCTEHPNDRNKLSQRLYQVGKWDPVHLVLYPFHTEAVLKKPSLSLHYCPFLSSSPFRIILVLFTSVHLSFSCSPRILPFSLSYSCLYSASSFFTPSPTLPLLVLLLSSFLPSCFLLVFSSSCSSLTIPTAPPFSSSCSSFPSFSSLFWPAHVKWVSRHHGVEETASRYGGSWEYIE